MGPSLGSGLETVRSETTRATPTLSLSLSLGLSLSLSLSLEPEPERAPGQVLLEGDLVDTCKPGDRVALSGIHRALPCAQQGQSAPPLAAP